MIGIKMSLRKKPWNRVSLPVYSISSQSKNGNGNMNICTYISAVSMKPKRMMVAVYHGTYTLENVNANPWFVLQLLAAHQHNLVTLLGKQSGNKTDKIQRLEKRKLLVAWNGFSILKDALAIMQLQVINKMEAGDHCLFICDIAAYKNLHEGESLTTKILHEKRIIRI